MIAMGEGSRHAIFGFLGMLFGAAAFAEVYPLISSSLLKVGDFGTIRFPELTGMSPWVLIGVWTAVAIGLFVFLWRSERPNP